MWCLTSFCSELFTCLVCGLGPFYHPGHSIKIDLSQQQRVLSLKVRFLDTKCATRRMAVSFIHEIYPFILLL